jgi:ubiquinone/menaquinone biosynthesis C-methylase UbiE
MTTTVGTQNEAPRVAWLKQALAAVPAGSRILDAGAGEQQFKPLCSHLKYVSQDFAQYDPKALNDGIQTAKWDYGTLDIVSDITAIPEPDKSFDAILCTEVFEHLPNPVEALKEFSRLLGPGGLLIATAPFCSLTHFAPHYYANGFSPYWYKTHLAALNFEILELTPNGNFFEYLAQETLRLPQMAKRYAADQLTPDEKSAMQTLLGALQRLTQKDTTSSELLCFGYHLRARRL